MVKEKALWQVCIERIKNIYQTSIERKAEIN
jgi:hypothetical protein